MKPRLLDLFCGAGGAAMGYHRAGFEVVGVDIKPQPNYPFAFVQGDATKVPDWAWPWPSGYRFPEGFAAVHASPPCQLWSRVTPAHRRRAHVDLIEAIREPLEKLGLPYVIENVPGAPLKDYVVLCGSSFGLRVRRHRLFETNWPLLVPPCIHGSQGQPVGVYGHGSGTGQKRGRMAANVAERREVMEMPWADLEGVTQAIPPAYTEFIGTQLMAYLNRGGIREGAASEYRGSAASGKWGGPA